MAYLPATRNAPGEQVNSEPSRFVRQRPLLLTKLVPPRLPEILLPRDPLLQRLDNADTTRLALVCAPAGFGKTTLLTQWYHHRQQQGDTLAWINLEQSDNAPLLLTRYLLEALRPLYQGGNTPFQSYLAGHPPDNFSVFIAGLINQLHLCAHPLYLILDDYQNIHHPEIHHGIACLLEHAPSSLHLIIGSRCQLPLALGRLQIQDQLVEIYDDELRFTVDETSRYFRHALPCPPDKRDIQQLVATTEGWIAGIKIATLPPRQSTHMPCFISALPPHSRALTRYLEEVVFAPLPADIFTFLLQTSILTHLHPTLCNAVTGQNNGAEKLTWLAQHNLFISSLDESDTWFRYHPLIRDALLNRLQQGAQSHIHLLHERAGNWFATQQRWAEAIRHALAAGQSAIRHAEAGAQSLAEEGDIETMVRCIHALTPDTNCPRIELQLNLAWALAHRFRFHDARQLLNAIETWVTQNNAPLAHSTWVKLRVVRAICEAFADNISDSIEIVEPLLQEIPCGDIWVDGLVCNILSYCHLAALRPQQALDIQRRLTGHREEKRHLFVQVYRTFIVAQGHLRQGNLQEAQHLAQMALQYAEADAGANSSSGATLAPILAAIAWERGEVEHIDALLRLRLKMIDDFAPPDSLSHCYLVLARQAQHDGQTQEAEALLVHAEQLAAQRGWSGAQAPLLAEQLTLSLASGNRDKACRLLNALQVLAQQTRCANNRLIAWSLSLCQSRLLIANGEPLIAAPLLDALVAEQEQCGEWLSAVQSRLLLAMALWRSGAAERAAAVCKPALQRALHQTLRRSLSDAGPDLLRLLNHMRKQQGPHDTFTDIIAQLWLMLSATEMPSPANDTEASPLKLTDREQQILRLIAEGYPNKSIARILTISAETVKWHLKHLYEKLHVSNRTQAVNQARKWHLLH